MAAKPKAAAEEASEAPEPAGPAVRRGQVKTGIVVSSKMDKTIVVAVERRFMHSLYQRFVRRTSKFVAHDEANDCNVGDVVSIVACRPLSKRKRWRVREVVKRAL